ncbi:hypothetical protein CQW23_23016 [Capsicum baccatum]|uniref:Uncharacterized protein n=1 Tax=Capsicum baccatum TaxID=33114 RepID=A0A2G2W2L1_CAPBA|nr:hypothetical protein CQW23_23016 [Capsicum baccatum]
MYLENKKLENFPNNIDMAIEFLLVFLDADVSNHVNNGNWLNEVMEKVAAIAGDVLYVIQKLLPRSIDKDATSEIDIFSMQILEKTKDLKAPVESNYKSLKFTPSQFRCTCGGLRFLDSRLSKLNEMLKSKSDLDFLMKPLFDNLERELSTLTSILEEELSSLSSIFRDVAKVHHEHVILKDFQRRTVSLAYEAEVGIDSILVHYNVFWHIFCSLPTILKEIKQINAEVTEMWSADVALKPHYVVDPSKHLPSQHSNPVSDDDEIVGTEKLIRHLTRGTSELDVIPIVGMGGQGKTTIARTVYDDKIIVSHFDIRAWCVISQRYNLRDLLQKIFSQVTGSMDEGEKDDILADKLRKSLIRKRYLIALDDMWDGMAWDDLRLCFPDCGNNSRIIVTTRLEKVGVQVKYHTDPYSLPFLTAEESCQLLHKKAFQTEDCPFRLQDVSQRVAGKCKGLPLVVVLVAGIIKKRKMEESWWNKVKDGLLDYLDPESEAYSRATMQLSFDNLSDCLKPCLLYMGMFQEDSRIRVSKLVSLWIAEGFVQDIESAEDCLMDLISSNVVMVSNREYNGKVKYCQVHDVVLHFCLEKSIEENLLAVKGHLIQFQPSEWKGSRVSFSFSKELSKFTSLVSKTGKPFHQHLRSLITTNYTNAEWNPFRQVSEVRLLKVLDLSSFYVRRSLSSATLKPLIHLKYLAVEAEKFHFHPEPHLPHLETLIVRFYGQSPSLPASFWKMKKLRHVEINYAELDLEDDKQGIFEESSKMENLRILRGVKYHGDRLNVLLRRCPNLHELEISFQDIIYDTCISLELESLTQLHLSFTHATFLSGLHLPSNLKKLVLRIRIENVMSFSLPSLEYLQLQETPVYSRWIRCWHLEDFKFLKLKYLKMVNLGISRWEASEDSFPQLETLVIKSCRDLEKIPHSFVDITTLKMIKLID